MNMLEKARVSVLSAIDTICQDFDPWLNAKVSKLVGKPCLACLNQGFALFITIIGYALFFVEIVLWKPMTWVAAAVGELKPFRFLGGLVAAAPMWVVYSLVFIILLGVSLPVKLVGLYLLFTGHLLLSLAVGGLGKVTVTFLLARLYAVRGEDIRKGLPYRKLMQLLAWLDTKWWWLKVKVPMLRAKDYLHTVVPQVLAEVRKHPVWLALKRQGRRIRTLFRVWRAQRKARPGWGGAAA